MVHDLDPAILHLPFGAIYWYGAVYSAGFLGVFLWFRLRRRRIGLSLAQVYLVAILVAVGILVGGRVFDILVYEFGYYRANPLAALNWWNGGMASHGVLLGAAIAIILFARWAGKPVLVILDEIVVPGAFLLALGRLGNFIEGGVIGSATDMPWGVIYPDVEGARHPVALYESAKNLVIVPVLIVALRFWPSGQGRVMSLFALLYAGLRFLVDLLRDYEATWLGMDTGQVFNLAMALAGLALLVWFIRRPPAEKPVIEAPERDPSFALRFLLVALIVYPLGIPTSWTKENIETKRQEAMPVVETN